MNTEFEQNQIMPSSEKQEIDPTASARWFAGALEVGGTVGLSIHGGKGKYLSASPFIIFVDSNEQFNQSLKQEFGGSIPPSNPREWRLSGYKAAEIIADLEPYVVSRQEIVLAVQNWLNSDTAERIDLAQQMKGYDRYQVGSVEEYERIVSDPVFVAGVLDNRGNIYPSSAKGSISPRVAVQSRNKAVLDALQKQFGGTVVVTLEPGTKRLLGDKVIEAKRTSYQWETASAQARNLIQVTSDYLKLPPYEGWDKRQIEVAQQERVNQATQVNNFIIEEIDKYKRGEISTLSTAEELATKFSLSHRTAKRRLATLPAGIRRQRDVIIRSTHTRILTEQDSSSLAKVITQEVTDYLEGRRERLTYNEDWARQAGVGVYLIERHVLPQLAKEIQSSREQLLRSQSTRDRNKKYANPSAKEE